MGQTHDQKVVAIARNVKKFYALKRPFRIFHGSTNSTRVMTFKADEMLDVSALDQVLSIDEVSRTAVVEPNVPMDALLKATLKQGLLPPVVMEFPGITVGGAIQGNGGESSSFKWGCFNQVFNWYELLLPDGSIVRASSDQNSDLFYATAGSAGTIGVLLSAEVKLIPAMDYVDLRYIPVHNFADAQRKLSLAVSKDSDFVDAIMFSAQSGVVIAGTLSHKPSSRIVRFSRAFDQWYYLHVGDRLHSQPDGWTESVPITDYLFRYDRGAFWVGRFAFEQFNVPYNRFMRWLLNPILHTRKLYQALQESGASQQHVVQDLVIPEDKTQQFLEFIDTNLNIYPLWLCPMLADSKATFQLNNIPAPSLMNIGVWGSNIPNYDDFLAANRLIEKQTLASDGKKWSYAHSYFTESEFWSMYDKPRYDSLRQKYKAQYLPNIYDKVTVKHRHPVERRKAVLRTIFGLAKLRIDR